VAPDVDRTSYDELMQWEQSAKDVTASRRPLDIPLVVLTAGLSGGPGEEIHQELQRDMVTLSTRACHVIARRSGHVITADEPHLVVEAIRAVMEAGKDGRSRPGC
jgi:hypothetical protein